jgi:hypothetical protein
VALGYRSRASVARPHPQRHITWGATEDPKLDGKWLHLGDWNVSPLGLYVGIDPANIPGAFYSLLGTKTMRAILHGTVGKRVSALTMTSHDCLSTACMRAFPVRLLFSCSQ